MTSLYKEMLKRELIVGRKGNYIPVVKIVG